MLKIIRKPDVIDMFGFSKSTLQNRINDELMPPPISLGARSVGFLLHEIHQVFIARLNGDDDEQVKKLVRLIKSRRHNVIEELV